MTEVSSFFVDTNVLLYSVDADVPEKQHTSQEWVFALWNARAGRVSWQVINELYSNAVCKLAVPVPAARIWAEKIIEWRPEVPSHATILRAWYWCDAAKINFWDSLIVAAAEQAGCRYLLSEDFQAGRRFDGLTVVDPFAHSPKEFFN